MAAGMGMQPGWLVNEKEVDRDDGAE